MCLLRLTVRSNVKPKCGNKSFLTLHVFLYPVGYGLVSVIVNATPKTIDVIDLALFEFEVDGQSPEVITANQRACEVRVRGKG